MRAVIAKSGEGERGRFMNAKLLERVEGCHPVHGAPSHVDGESRCRGVGAAWSIALAFHYPQVGF